MNKIKFKKAISVLIAIIMCFGFSTVTFAKSEDLPEEKHNNSNSSDVTTYAINGSGVSYIDGYGEFVVYCSGWSLFGKAHIVVNNTSDTNIVTIQIRDPNGNQVGQPIIVTGSGTLDYNLVNIGASYYTIAVQTSQGGASVVVTFSDR